MVLPLLSLLRSLLDSQNISGVHALAASVAWKPTYSECVVGLSETDVLRLGDAVVVSLHYFGLGLLSLLTRLSLALLIRYIARRWAYLLESRRLMFGDFGWTMGWCWACG